MTKTEKLRSSAAAEERAFVRLSRRDAEDALRLLKRLSSSLAEDLPPTIDRAQFIRLARIILDQRQERVAVLPQEMFGEPAWDMLLELYALGDDSKTDLCNLSGRCGSPRSTAARWIDYLEDQQLLTREFDQGREFAQLTCKARRILDSYFCQILSGKQP